MQQGVKSVMGNNMVNSLMLSVKFDRRSTPRGGEDRRSYRKGISDFGGRRVPLEPIKTVRTATYEDHVTYNSIYG